MRFWVINCNEYGWNRPVGTDVYISREEALAEATRWNEMYPFGMHRRTGIQCIELCNNLLLFTMMKYREHNYMYRIFEMIRSNSSQLTIHPEEKLDD